MRMAWCANCFAWRVIRRTHFVEHQKWIDLIQLRSWKWATNSESTAFNRAL
jgi:hypothetical protein